MILKYIGRGALFVLGLLILGMSFVRTSLTITAQENGENLKNDRVEFTVLNKDGNKETASYKLPEVGMLPNSMFYGFKRVRDYLWLGLSRGIDKPKIVLLMADKKVTEYRKLASLEENDKAVEAGIEAVDKLKYANDLISEIKPQDNAVAGLQRQIWQAGQAYQEVFSSAAKKFEINQQEGYQKLISTINDWNKKQEEQRFTWDR